MDIKDFFYVDNLSLLMMGLIGFVGICIASFSRRYLQGDLQQKAFFINLSLLLGSVSIMVCADNLILFLVSWFFGNYILTRLMLHKKEWSAAQASAHLALRNFILGTFFIGIGFTLLYLHSGSLSLQTILKSSLPPIPLFIATLFIFLGSMTQSALWPFHQWLTSSLNSPTPVSALMHAGLINGGGFLLARCAPLFLQQPLMLHTIFIIGIFSALLGTTWKLMQNDIKRMLACSTMGQMGFMIAQCGLGLFGAALAHLFWHGLFKAYLFLGSDSIVQQKKLKTEQSSIASFLTALLYGSISAATFCFITNKALFPINTNLFLIILVALMGTQFVLPLLNSTQPFKYIGSVCASIAIGTLYGLSVKFIYIIVAPLHITQPQPFTFIYGIGLLLLISTWLCMIFGLPISHTLLSRWYVTMLNASQPHKDTVTTHRKSYHYKGVDNE